MPPPPPRRPSAAPSTAATALPREGAIARTLRWARDRRGLAELDGRLLRDVGLTRGDVARGVPFTAPSAAPEERRAADRDSGVRRIGRLDARGWRLKLYAPDHGAAGLRPEDLAAAGRAFRAVLAEPRPAPTPGFALLASAADAGAWAGALALTAYWWEGADLHRSALLLAGGDAAPRRAPERTGRLGSVAELDLLARECRAWREKVLDAAAPSPAAYLAECCA